MFQTILENLDATPSYDRAVTLGRLGRSLRVGGQPDLAAAKYREGLTVLAQLEPSESVKRLTGALHTDLADVLRDRGRFAEARQEYEAGLAVGRELGDVRGQGVSLGQLGTLAMREGDLGDALKRHQAALALFQQLGEPATEAIAWHQLGRVLEKDRQWQEAERHFRESARIKEAQGDVAGAARTWNQLANLSMQAGKLAVAEQWYRKAIEGSSAQGDLFSASIAMSNLAGLLQEQPGRLGEARELAGRALAIDQSLDPGVAEIWKTYGLLAEIGEKEAAQSTDPQRQGELLEQVQAYRQKAREAQRAFAGTRHELKRHVAIIVATVLAVHDSGAKDQLDAVLTGYGDGSWKEMVGAIERIVAGERDEKALQDGQFGHAPMIVDAILQGIEDPSSLADLLPEETDSERRVR